MEEGARERVNKNTFPVLTSSDCSAESAEDVHSLSFLLAGTFFEAVICSSIALNVVSEPYCPFVPSLMAVWRR